MQNLKVKVVNESTNDLPMYATPQSAGLDLRADFSRGVDDKFFDHAAYDEVRDVILLFPKGRCLIPTGLKTSFEDGFEAQIRPRSGLALKHGITVLNTPGTIEGDYRDEWGIILFNNSESVFEVAHGDRIAQVVFSPIARAEFEETILLKDSDRKGGFGHTGTK